MAKIVAFLEKMGAVLAALLTAVVGFRLFSKHPVVPGMPPDVLQKQDAADRQTAQRQAQVLEQERVQSDIQSKAQQLDQKIAAETQRIEGLDRDAVARELASIDSAASEPPKPKA